MLKISKNKFTLSMVVVATVIGAIALVAGTLLGGAGVLAFEGGAAGGTDSPSWRNGDTGGG